MSNTALWESLFQTDAAHTKKFTKGGGFSGTAIKPFWVVKRMTETFGPQGKGWGWTIHEEKTFEAATGEVLWLSRLSIWYIHNNERLETSQQWGQTLLVAKRKDGMFVDEEAPKKSITDAFTKCASYLGLGGDVHMGLFDDSKYVADMAQNPTKAEVQKELDRTKKAADAPQKPQDGRLVLYMQGDRWSAHGTMTAFLDAFDTALNSADDKIAFFDLNSKTLGEMQAKAAAAKNKPGEAIVQRISEIHDRIHDLSKTDNLLRGA